MSANFGLSLDIAANVVIGRAILVPIWLGISLMADTGLLGTGLLVLIVAFLAALGSLLEASSFRNFFVIFPLDDLPRWSLATAAGT